MINTTSCISPEKSLISDEDFFKEIQEEMPTDLRELVCSYVPEMHEAEMQAVVSKFYLRFTDPTAIEEIDREIHKIEKKYGSSSEIKQITFADISYAQLNEDQFDFLKTIVKRVFPLIEKIGFQDEKIVELNPEHKVVAPPVVAPPPRDLELSVGHKFHFGRRRRLRSFKDLNPGPF